MSSNWAQSLAKRASKNVKNGLSSTEKYYEKDAIKNFLLKEILIILEGWDVLMCFPTAVVGLCFRQENCLADSYTLNLLVYSLLMQLS